MRTIRLGGVVVRVLYPDPNAYRWMVETVAEDGQTRITRRWVSAEEVERARPEAW